MMTCTGFCFLFCELTCTTPAVAPPPAARYCQVAEPVRPARNDTPETIRQARREFAKWKALCAPKR